MLAREAIFSYNFSPMKWNIEFSDETNGILKKIILFCVLNMFRFRIKCGYTLKMHIFFDKTTIFHQIILLAWRFTEVQDKPYFFSKINLKKNPMKTVEIG